MSKTSIFFYLYLAMDSLISHIILYLYAFAVIDEKIQWKKIGKILSIVILPATMFYTLVFIIVDLPAALAYSLNSLMVLSVNVIVAKWMFKWDIWKCISILSMSAVLQVASAVFVSAPAYFLNATTFFSMMFLIYPLEALIISSLMKKFHFGRYIQPLLEDKKHLRTTALLAFLLECSVEIFALSTPYLSEDSLITFNAALVLLVLFIFCLLIYLSYIRESRRKLKLQETLLLQQQMYVENLEEIQKEMRAFRHDYKNMLSSIYLCAEEGEVEAMKTYLKNMELDFDEKIGENIRKTTQLGNIHIIEVKGLLLAKLAEMNKKQITCNLEILYPITKLGIDTLDFNRCLGILLDNAIEAVEHTEHPVIDLILSNQENCITIVVKNPWYGKLALHSIWKEGYSTKGSNRGLGLTNYQNILAKYPNASPATQLKNNEFVQELKIIYGR